MDELPPDFVLLLTIRFSASIPDLLLEIPSPSSTTGAGLKQLIRAKIPPELAAHRLRLIYAGRALEDDRPLVESLRLDPRRLELEYAPPPDHEDENADEEGIYSDPRDRKGKTPVRYGGTMAAPSPSQTKWRVKTRLYIHCSVGDLVLDAAELADEARLAEAAVEDESLPESRSNRLRRGQGEGAQDGADAGAASTTTPAPRGFDRLLAAGFTVQEVSALRSQFLALQSLTHTPDTMPSGEELRLLEDRWMDEGSTSDGGQESGALGAGIDAEGGLLGSGGSSGLDDMLWGSMMGFFWPVGCAVWLLREEGIWSWRKGLAVFVGVVVNCGFGAVRVLT